MRKSRRSVSIAALTAVAFMALVAMPARGAESLVLAPSSGPAGTTVEATADGFLAGPVTFWWDNSILLGTVPSGRVRRLTFDVPAGAGAGPHTVRACAGSRCPPGATFVDATFNVVAPTPRPTPTPTRTLNPTAPPSTPAPTATQVPTPTAPRTSPAPATPEPTATSLPTSASGSPTPAGGALGSTTPTPDPTGFSAAPSAEAPVSVVVPSTEPVGDPSAPGTVKVQFPWLPLSILVVLLGVAAAAASRWIRMAQPHAGGPKLMQGFSAGTHDPPKAPSGTLPPELPVMASLVESSAGPAAGDPLVTHEAAHTGQAADGPRSGGAALMNAMLLDGDTSAGGTTGANEQITIHGNQNAPPPDEPLPPKVNDITVTKQADGTSGGEKDVQMKGSKINEN